MSYEDIISEIFELVLKMKPVEVDIVMNHLYRRSEPKYNFETMWKGVDGNMIRLYQLLEKRDSINPEKQTIK